MKKFITVLALFSLTGSAFALVGAPGFYVGQGAAHVALEGTRSVMSLHSPSMSGADEDFMMQRAMVTARYGVLPNVECAAQFGAANLVFKDLPFGYNDYDSRLAAAWGTDVRFGLPMSAARYQIVGGVKYFGASPSGETSNGSKTIHTKYLWHEISPSLTAGYRFGVLVPYLGFTKSYLFGTKEVDVQLNGKDFPTAGEKSNYSDGRQPVRTILGIKLSWPRGYALNSEAAVAAGGIWTLSVGVSQVLK